MGKKSVADFIITENIPLNKDNYLIRLKSPESLPPIKPGQFVNIDIKNSSEIFLRRPFSVFETDYKNNSISIIVKVLGRGSKKLTEVKAGEVLSLVYPLGKHFTYPSPGDKVLAVGGGSGLAPMLFLARESGLPAENMDIIIGARSATDHIDASAYNKYGNIYFTTEDGTLGTRGLVTHHPLFGELANYDKIYACGPEGMMKAVAREAKKTGVFCEVSLENLMACGFGVCLCCIEPTVNGNLCVCTEGPVFNINDLKWQI
ncbi:dihydroorotate dehydrogenase electron transfer subunit [Mariniphaga sediminis]|uniref:Dihydroorotate dehydrogenase electron transfer subunit n=1 Tax=Mariniphaga sediminis TaxID=1628158 RepID=A0A399CXI1_9BACT|nr:dihydroorotate dehydrogenase electron transfer subunit [Mariniphaga sediminis]RIH63182.1 dihydroorotate dehydrogenase electron transfer subunit [Mariniphaga sediminis]